MQSKLDKELLDKLQQIPEIELCGFMAREGLTGAGVTVLKGPSYFGSWRITAGALVWVHANIQEPNHFETSVDDAVRHTLLLILRSLERSRHRPTHQAVAS